MKNKVISGFVLLVVLICTCVIYHLLFDEHSKLFYINVITACIIETILLANIPILSNEKLLTFKNAATAAILNMYAIFLFLWTSVYSLYIEEEDYKTLYIGMLVISVIFAVLFGTVELGGIFMRKQDDDFRQVIQNKKIFLVSLNMYWAEIQNSLLSFQSDWKEHAFQELKMAIDKIATIPSEKLETNAEITTEINNKLNNIKELFQKVSENAESLKLQQQTYQEIEQLKNYIIAIKSIF